MAVGRTQPSALGLLSLINSTTHTMIDYTTKEIIDAGYNLLEASQRARKASRKADLKRQAFILFNEVNHQPAY